jgi:uncharacterized membrane protein YkoI
MKLKYVTTGALALTLVTGCLQINVEKEGGEHKAKHSEKEEGEDREGHESKGDRKEKEEGEEKEDRESKGEHARGEEKEAKDSPARLKAEAKISEAEARETAMRKVPNGTIKEGELERENGHLQWSFDIAVPGDKDITEVNVDAISGRVLNVAKEAAESEKAEKEKEKEN